jgi:ribose transport system substrate-binding protein
MRSAKWALVVIVVAAWVAGCGKPQQGAGDKKPPATSRFILVADKLDETDRAKAKNNVEDVINGYTDIKLLVGLWSYNGPAIASALKASGEQDKIIAVCFDEEDDTLQAVKDGLIKCTVVQKPFEFGYQSSKMLVDLCTKKKPGTKPEDLKIAFVTNNASDFWTIAQKGVQKAEKELGIKVAIKLPVDGTAAQQQEIINDLVSLGYDGMAISPKDPDSMTDILNKAADKMVLICHDSDAPKSKRVAYIGTNNYDAGRILGEQIKKLLPDGGKMAIFVGTLSAENASQRRQGILDVLEGKPISRLAETPTATVVDTGVDVINKDNVGAFWAKLKELRK